MISLMSGVLLFVMQGCPACTSFKPRFERLAAPYRRAGVSVQIIDVGRYVSQANQYKVTATPTTLVVRNGRVVRRLVGAVEDGQVQEALEKACGRGCPV